MVTSHSVMAIRNQIASLPACRKVTGRIPEGYRLTIVVWYGICFYTVIYCICFDRCAMGPIVQSHAQPMFSRGQGPRTFLLTGTKSWLPGARSLLPGTRPLLPGTRSLLPGTRSLLPGSWSLLPGSRSPFWDPGLASRILDSLPGSWTRFQDPGLVSLGGPWGVAVKPVSSNRFQP